MSLPHPNNLHDAFAELVNSRGIKPEIAVVFISAVPAQYLHETTRNILEKYAERTANSNLVDDETCRALLSIQKNMRAKGNNSSFHPKPVLSKPLGDAFRAIVQQKFSPETVATFAESTVNKMAKGTKSELLYYSVLQSACSNSSDEKGMMYNMAKLLLQNGADPDFRPPKKTASDVIPAMKDFAKKRSRAN